MDLHHILPQISVTDHGPSSLSMSMVSSSPPHPTTLHKLAVPDLVAWSGPAPSPSPSPRPSLSPHDDQWWTGKYDLAAKIIILGDYGVGKTSFLTTLAAVKDMGWCRCVAFKPNEYVEMECTKNDKKILIRLMDTGGQERFRSMTSSYFRGAHGCLLMFNVTNEESFNNVINWYNDLGVYAPPDNISNISAIVVGNTNSADSDHERCVTAERAFRLAESLNLTYCETHVHNQQTVLCILTRLVNNVIMNRMRRQSLAITIMPPSVQVKARRKTEKRRWRCCRTS
ncbi:uncharacterized protein LOC143274932 [Babylonia areolata]|uniref:uncharacterized protein LOC143274932 n=1 Tax=Babylonia areolata TaxID=304850 RepID=UPI003FCF2EA4